jgi:hypothetical protein
MEREGVLESMPPYQMPENFSLLHFMPWIGKDYETGGVLGTRILLLGESHYSKKFYGHDREITSNYTRHIIQQYAVEKSDIFHAKVRRLVLRGLNQSINWDTSKQQRQAFWDSVAFSNYIQEFVGKKPKERPAHEAWPRAAEGLWEVLERLRPEFCVVLGKTLWDHLPRSSSEPSRSVVSFVDEASKTAFKRFTADGRDTYFAHTAHPSSIGYYRVTEAVATVRSLFAVKPPSSLAP